MPSFPSESNFRENCLCPSVHRLSLLRARGAILPALQAFFQKSSQIPLFLLGKNAQQRRMVRSLLCAVMQEMPASMQKDNHLVFECFYLAIFMVHTAPSLGNQAEMRFSSSAFQIVGRTMVLTAGTCRRGFGFVHHILNLLKNIDHYKFIFGYYAILLPAPAAASREDASKSRPI